MSDFKLCRNKSTGTYDLMVGADGDFIMDDGLETSVLMSLNIKRQALPDDVLPDADAPDGGSKNYEGWWGDWYLTPPADPSVTATAGARPTPTVRWGSRRWLLWNAKNTPDVPQRLAQYDTEALSWIPDNGIGTVTVSAWYVPSRPTWIYERIAIKRPGQPDSVYAYLWNAMLPQPLPVPAAIPPSEILDPLGAPILDPGTGAPVLEP